MAGIGIGITGLIKPNVDVAGKAASYVSSYDRNGDGSINVTAFDNETTRTEPLWQHDSYGPRHPRMKSLERLARLADLLGDGNGKATAAEIEAVMKAYDVGDAYGKPSGATSGDGWLTANEWYAFDEDLGEETSAWGPLPYTKIPRLDLDER